MNGLSYLLDTNTIIGLLKGNDEAISILSGITSDGIVELPGFNYG